MKSEIPNEDKTGDSDALESVWEALENDTRERVRYKIYKRGGRRRCRKV